LKVSMKKAQRKIPLIVPESAAVLAQGRSN